jgi:hypothetical protein
MENMSLRLVTVHSRMAWTCGLIGIAGLMLSAGVTSAQTTGLGYVVAGVGLYSNGFSSGPVVQFGGGGEALIQNRLGFGGELGLAYGGGDVLAALSLNASLHFPKPGATNAVVPFVSGGYTRMAVLTESGRNALNVSGVLTYWFSERHGLLLEFRDVLYKGLGTDQSWTARVGITSR